MKTHIRFSRHAALIAFLALASFGATLATNSNSSRAQQASQSNPLSGLRWRNIGPFRGGRSVAGTGAASQPMVCCFGGTGGRVFKTTDGGANWETVSDGQPIGAGTVRAIEVSHSAPNVVYVGMGEACIRGNFSHGDGVYKSTDAGKTWKRVALEDSRIIGRIRIHPK